MIIDTSAIAALLFGEPDADRIEDALIAAPDRRMSAATALELAIVVEARLGEAGGRDLDLLLHRTRVEIVPFDEPQKELARRAWRRFGKGRHPAALNLGNCYAYALARSRGEPLLFIGDNFSKTDIEPALRL